MKKRQTFAAFWDFMLAFKPRKVKRIDWRFDQETTFCFFQVLEWF